MFLWWWWWWWWWSWSRWCWWWCWWWWCWWCWWWWWWWWWWRRRRRRQRRRRWWWWRWERGGGGWFYNFRMLSWFCIEVLTQFRHSCTGTCTNSFLLCNCLSDCVCVRALARANACVYFFGACVLVTFPTLNVKGNNRPLPFAYYSTADISK